MGKRSWARGIANDHDDDEYDYESDEPAYQFHFDAENQEYYVTPASYRNRPEIADVLERLTQNYWKMKARRYYPDMFNRSSYEIWAHLKLNGFTVPSGLDSDDDPC